MSKFYFFILLFVPFTAFNQVKQIAFAELTSGSGMFFGAEMTPTTITITVQGPSDRFLAFGFGTGMGTGNDALIWSTLGTGVAPLQVRDHRMIGQGNEPTVDAQQDWTVISNDVSGGNRTIVASRALSTGDANDATFSFAATTQNLFWAKGPSATNQLQYHGGSNRASGIVRNWVTLDTTPPVINSKTPADNTNGVSITSNINIVFSEPISWGAGSLVLYDGNDNVIQTVSSGNAQVIISGAVFSYNPPANLVLNTDYYVQIDATAFKDAANNFFTGISDETTWNFNTNDVVAPVLTASPFVPADNASGVSLNQTLTATFSEAVQFGTGVIELFDGSGLVESFDVSTSPQLSVAGAVVTINPTTDLTMNTSYYVHIAGTAIQDLSSNNYAGIANNTTWNFNTNDIVAPMLVAPFVPADDAVNITPNTTLSVTFNEDVQLSAIGAIELFDAGGTLIESFGTGSAQLAVNGSTVTITPTNPLAESTDYYVHITAGFIEDLMANDFAGIADNTTWNFSVGDFTAPTIVTLSPADDEQNVQIAAEPVITFSEGVMLGTGDIELEDEDNGMTETFNTTNGNVTVSGNTVTLHPAGDLQYETHYHIVIDSDALVDLSGNANAFAGISDITAWSFQTESDAALEELSASEFSWNGTTLTIKTAFTSGEIRDLNGKLVQKIEQAITELNALPAGIYMLVIEHSSKLSMVRIYVD
jgi:methionine-rich copper-binding protein CopC